MECVSQRNAPSFVGITKNGICLELSNLFCTFAVSINIKYIKDEKNCLFYTQGNIEEAVAKIERLTTDKALRDKLIEEGLKTAKSREWSSIEKDIVDLYKEK